MNTGNKLIAGPRSADEQMNLMDWSMDIPLHSYAKARPYIGDFFEEASKELFSAARLKTQAGRWCPDLKMETGGFLEIKSVGKNNGSLVFDHRVEEDQRFMARGCTLYYVFWQHGARVTDRSTVKTLWADLALAINRVVIVSAKVVYEALMYAKRRFTTPGKAYGLRPARSISSKMLRSWATGQATFSFVRNVYGHKIPPIPVYGMFNR